MPRRNRKKGRGGRRDAKRGGGSNRFAKIAALIALPATVLGVGGYGMSEYIKIEKIGADYCYARSEQMQTAIFLDYSINHQLTGAQRRDLRLAMERSYAASKPNGKIMIFTTARDTSASIAEPVFTICRPAETRAEQEAIGAPSKTAPNLRHISDEAKNTFLAAIDRVMAETEDDRKAARESPLLASLQAISRYPGFQGSTRRFVWLSDGIENSEIARFGAVQGDMPSAATFVEKHDYDLIQPDPLTDVDVTVLLVESIALPQPGLDYVTHSEMRRWWPEFFQLNGAWPVRLQRLRRVTGS